MLAFTAHNENKSKTFMSALLSCRTIERSSLQLKETNMFTVFFRSRGFAFVLLQKACKIIAQESRSWIFTLQFFLWSETEVVLDTSSWHDEYNCESEIALLFRSSAAQRNKEYCIKVLWRICCIYVVESSGWVISNHLNVVQKCS